MLVDHTVRELLERVASGEPVPGGGSIAALCAALAAGLAEMVAHLTVGRLDDPALDREMNDLIDRARALRSELTRAVDHDSEAYSKVMQAYRGPKSTDELKRLRTEAIQEALKEAARVPLAVAEMGVEILGLASIAVNKGNRNAVTDGLVGALMARSAVLAAIANVRINLQSIIDVGFVQKARADSEFLEKKALAAEEMIRSAAQPKVTGGR
jgi:formiminotetrahydrofolate cyclodeaminase